MISFKQFLIEAVEIVPLTKRTWPPVPEGGSDQARTMMFTALNDFDRGIKRVIAVDGGKTVGAASYYLDKDDLILDRMGSLQKGAGAKLLQFVIDQAKKSGSKRVVLWASEGADQYYQRFGFKDTGEEDGHRVLDLSS